jgi:predicted dehydrogenase
MKQILRRGLKDIVVETVPDPTAGAHHVLIRPACSLISSGTETASIHNESILKEVAENRSHLRKVWEVSKVAGPARTLAEVKAKFSEYAVLGYSGAGVVVEKHPTVTNVDVGDRVAYGGEGTGHAETVVAGENLVAKIPDGVTFEHACFATLGSIALNAVRIAQVGVGDVVAIIGVGLVGQLVAQLVRLQSGVAVAIDLKPDRLALATKLGADHAVPTAAAAEAIGALTGGRGADCVIVAAATKSAEPCRQAVEICRDRGRMVIVGNVDMTFSWSEMYRKELQLFMSRAYGPGSYDPSYERQGRDYPVSYVRWTEKRNMEEFLRLVALGRVDVAPLITHEFALDDAPQAYRTLMDGATNSLAVVLRYSRVTSDTPDTFTPHRKVEVSLRRRKNGELRVAVHGAGNIARWAHLPAVSRAPGVTLHAVCSASGPRGMSYARRFGARYCYSDYAEMLNDPDVDVVVITTRNQSHAAEAIAALRAGKDVFIEKPMAVTEDECRAVLRAAEDSGRHLTVGFNRRFAPFYVEQKRRLAERSAPAVINCRVNSPGISGSYWMADPAIGGAIVGEACHFVDLMYWLLDSEPMDVSAFCLPTSGREPIGENNLVAVFRFADGSVGNLTYCTVGTKRSAGERVEVFAPGIAVTVEDMKRLEVRGTLRQTRSAWWPEKGYAAQLASFFETLRHGRAPEIQAGDGARATMICLRMLQSALRHREPLMHVETAQ